MENKRHHEITLNMRPPSDHGGANASPVPTFFGNLLASSLVLTEDFEKLSAQAQEEIRGCSELARLLPMLVHHGLLTEFQAARIEAGTTYGLILGNYRVLDRLGSGGMGVVFKAEHVVMRRTVAIKVLAGFGEED
ncbi:MAG: hypothetical protein EXS16_11275 [Gemmataceae bacterium]|nr:hypothetical protein [Gemmataceae bacterium]